MEGVSLPVFLKFLEFLYSGQVQDFEGLELDVLLVADRYQVDGLKVLCQSEMFDKVTPISEPRLSEGSMGRYGGTR